MFDLLTRSQSPTTINDAIFSTTDPVHPAGTGVLRPFLTVQNQGNDKTGHSEGFNTAGSLQFDTKRSNWTNGVPLSSLAKYADASGRTYYQFVLDINEPSGNTAAAKKGAPAAPPTSYLSMNELQFFLANTDTPTPLIDNSAEFKFNGFAPGQATSALWDLDAGGVDRTINLDAALNGQGSGTSDLYFYIPTSAFAGQPGAYRYLVLYAAFGDPYADDGGFQEFAFTAGVNPVPGPTPAPLPSVAAGGLVLLGGAVVRRGSRPPRVRA